MHFWHALAPWEFSPALCIVVVLAALLYCRHASQGSVWHQLSFWVGLASLYIVSHTDFDYYAEHEFFVHRLQHLVLHHLGPFLIVLGIPGAVWRGAASFPASRAVDTVRATARSPATEPASHSGRHVHADRATPAIRADAVNAAGSLLRWLCHPYLSAALFNLLVLFWLVPAVHFPAMLDWRLYRLMNASMLVNGLLFWAAVLQGAAPGWPQLRTGLRVGLMLAVIPAQIVIGALVFFAPRELYPVYTLCGRAFAGLSALEDQQIGGLILWIPGAMMSVVGILYVLQARLRTPASMGP